MVGHEQAVWSRRRKVVPASNVDPTRVIGLAWVAGPTGDTVGIGGVDPTWVAGLTWDTKETVGARVA